MSFFMVVKHVRVSQENLGQLRRLLNKQKKIDWELIFVLGSVLLVGLLGLLVILNT